MRFFRDLFLHFPWVIHFDLEMVLRIDIEKSDQAAEIQRPIVPTGGNQCRQTIEGFTTCLNQASVDKRQPGGITIEILLLPGMRCSPGAISVSALHQPFDVASLSRPRP